MLAESTTIDRPSLSLDVGQSRQIVRVDPSTDENMAIAVRALAVARAATHGPVVPDGPGLLSRVAQTGSPESAPDDLTTAVRDIVRRAAAEPERRIGASPTDTSSHRGDCVTTVGGAISHAAASARRFLC